MSEGSFAILRARDEGGRRRWTDTWARWPGREIFAHPDYLKLYEGPGQEALAAVLETDDGTLLYPFFRRSLAEEPFVPEDLRSCCDLVTPYGYGGPFFFGDMNARGTVARSFWASFESWAREQRCVSEFVRFSLFPEALAPYPGNVEERSQNVVRSLEPSPGEIWTDYEHKVRKNVKKALRSGVSVEVDPTGEHMDDFVRVYESTLARRGASKFFYFTRSYFESIARDLPKHYVYLHAIHRGEVVSSELLLISSGTIYSFLGGTLRTHFQIRPNDLLKHEAIIWARDRGLRWFVLGGGNKPDDGIYRYKLSFAPGGKRPFRVGQRILGPERYSALVEARGRYESGLGQVWEPREDYFPAYRA